MLPIAGRMRELLGDLLPVSRTDLCWEIPV